MGFTEVSCIYYKCVIHFFSVSFFFRLLLFFSLSVSTFASVSDCVTFLTLFYLFFYSCSSFCVVVALLFGETVFCGGGLFVDAMAAGVAGQHGSSSFLFSVWLKSVV